MPIILHQNMRTYSGSNAGRADNYLDAFADLGARLTRDWNAPIGVAGFTEVTNASAATFASITGCARSLFGLRLDAPDPAVLLFACGATALSRSSEYIAVALPHAPAAGDVGRVLRDNTNTWACYTNADCPIGQLPANVSRDFRGLAYVILWDGGAPLVVGFIHNMYTLADQRTLTYGGLPAMIDAIRRKHRLPPNAGFRIGGDFNVAPGAFSRRYAPLAPHAAVDAATGALIPTTTRNTYDYWVATTPPLALAVDVATRVPGLSDHAATAMLY